MSVKPARVRYFPGPQVWALAQDAYLGGESAGSIAARLGLTVNGIRKRAARKGWTRTQAAEALKRSQDPAEALADLLSRVGPLIRGGRLDEAERVISNAWSLSRAVRAQPMPRKPELDHEAMAAWRAAESRRLETYWEGRAHAMAHAMLTEAGYGAADGWAPGALKWRAEHLGPETAAHDFARGVAGGWAARYWDEDGRLWPIREPNSPSTRMQEQHQKGCEWLREKGERG